MTIYYRCEGVVSVVGNGNNPGSKCSTGWIQVDDPVYTTITVAQGEQLFVAFAGLFVTIAVFRALARIF